MNLDNSTSLEIRGYGQDTKLKTLFESALVVNQG